jgi:hypothetical protein
VAPISLLEFYKRVHPSNSFTNQQGGETDIDCGIVGCNAVMSSTLKPEMIS